MTKKLNYSGGNMINKIRCLHICKLNDSLIIQPKPPLAEFGSSLKTALPKGERRRNMSNYNDLIEFRNKLTNDTDYVIFEEDCQLLDRVLDDYEKKDLEISQLKSELKELKKNAIILPIGVGEELYYINYPEMKVESEIIDCVSIEAFEINNYSTWIISEYGKSWFKTREQAEEALKKAEGK